MIQPADHAARHAEMMRLAVEATDRFAEWQIRATGACVHAYGATWFDTAADWLDRLPYFAAGDIAKLARYLELRDKLVRHDVHPHLVRFVYPITTLPRTAPAAP